MKQVGQHGYASEHRNLLAELQLIFVTHISPLRPLKQTEDPSVVTADDDELVLEGTCYVKV